MNSLLGRPLGEAFAAVNNRGPGFDTLRVLAASAVMYHHASGIEANIVHDRIFAFTRGYTQLGLLSVSVFFALSGFLVVPGLLKSGDVLSYFSHRVMRIMPLLFVVVVLCALVVGPAITRLPLSAYFSDPLTWKYLRNVTTSLSLELPGIVNTEGGSLLNGSLWTLRFEWICYIILAFSSLLGVLRRRWLFLGLYVLAQAAVLLRYGFIPADKACPLPYLILMLFGYFGAGTLMSLFRDVIRWSYALIGVVALMLLVAAHAGLGYVVAPACVAYLVAGLGLVRFPWSRLLARADLSYGIYLMHSVILTILVNVHPFTSGVALFATCLPLACTAAWLSWTFIEAPALRHKDLPATVVRRFLRLLRAPAGTANGNA